METQVANRFEEQLRQEQVTLRRGSLEILQVNLGKLCNMTCSHCHVEAGPTQTRENMERSTVEAVMRLLGQAPVKTLDLTGGAPELNAHFRWLVSEATSLGIHVIDRCNLTVLYEAGQEDLARFLADHGVEIVASLPCYLMENVDRQRGRGTFELSIRALRQLNALGYGRGATDKILNLVYNPVGENLPPDQGQLERDYKVYLDKEFAISFDRLLTLTNMPITRYADYLTAVGKYEEYCGMLRDHFNPATLPNLMCRNTLSVGWDGRLYDCDFNQMLGMALGGKTIGEIAGTGLPDLEGVRIATGEHCFGCAAGAGSGCRGALKPEQE